MRRPGKVVIEFRPGERTHGHGRLTSLRHLFHSRMPQELRGCGAMAGGGAITVGAFEEQLLMVFLELSLFVGGLSLFLEEHGFGEERQVLDVGGCTKLLLKLRVRYFCLLQLHALVP